MPKNLWCESESDCQGILSGELADLNIWSRRFSSDEMTRFTKCESKGEGDLLSWGSAKWDFYNVGSEDKNLQVWDLAQKLLIEFKIIYEFKEICDEKEASFIIFPELRSYNDIFGFCRSMGAEMATPRCGIQLFADEKNIYCVCIRT